MPSRSVLRSLISLFAFFHLSNANCSHTFRFTDRSDANNTLWTLLEDTKQCDELMASSNLTGQGLVRACPDDLLDINLSPHSVFPAGKNILPYVQLNISITSLARLDELFLRFRCIYAPSSDDYLCHNHDIQLAKWGRMIWPCRRLQLLQDADREFRFHFSYTCFRLFSLSQYVLELFVRHHGGFCRRNLLISIPMERQLDPKIAHFYTGTRWNDAIFQKHPPLDWSPLVAIDNSFNDSLVINLHPTEWLLQNQRRPLTLSVYSFSSSSSYPLIDTNLSSSSSPSSSVHPQLLFAQQIVPSRNITNNGYESVKYRWRWSDVDAGAYLVYAHLERADCRLACGGAEQDKECNQCPHTALNFTLATHKHSLAWRQSRMLISVAKHIALGVFALLAIILAALIAGFLYIRVWRPRAFARLPPRAVELHGRPSVLVLYTDDCQAHSDVVMALCQTLEESANARCLVDQREFEANPTLRPSVWLADKLAECDFVLVLFSACSPRVLAGERLAQRRHFPDLFNTALGFVVARINEIALSEGVTLLSAQPTPNNTQQNGHPPNNPSGENTTSSSNANSKPNVSAKSQPNKQSQLARFVFARFAYSPPSVIPPFFASTQFGLGRGGPLVLPDNIGLLIARLHGVAHPLSPADSKRPQRFLHEANLDGLKNALTEFERFAESNPGWMEERFVRKAEAEEGKEEEPEEEQMEADRKNLMMSINRVPTEEEQKQMAERYGLLDVGSDEEEGGGGAEEKLPNRTKRYQLVMDGIEDENSSSSSSSSSSSLNTRKKPRDRTSF